MAQLRCHITRSARLSAVSLRALMLALFVAAVHAPPASADKETTDTMTASAEHKPRPTIPDAAILKTLPPDGGPGWNRLVFEKSPYLQQHAANPVDWYPWGEAAFAEARRRDVPVFLSVGYSTCHWCHVMEHESFEDPQVAALMNEAFVCVKVDREERPDIDHVYMTVTQAMTGSGGWPMTVIMTADKKPFFAGTYFPKDGRYGRPGMMELVPHIQEIWKSNRKKLTETADYIAGEIGKLSSSAGGDAPDQRLLDAAFEQFRERFDPYRGGFNERPKFPVPHNLSFLLRYWKRTGNPEALKMAEYTLERMSFGGINDQVGRGFHRYSTDERWLLPHFEKMLYDQALLALAYTDAYQATGKDLYRQNAEQILEYVSRDLTAPEGGFYSAEDADSEGEEGKFYVWSVGEVMQVLGNEEGMLFCKVYNFEADGNFHDERTGAKSGVNIPYLTRPVAEVAHQMNKTPEDVVPRIEAARRKLFLHREARVHPFKDDKILTDWNGLMIAAYARAANAFGEPRYTEAARRAADFCLATLRTSDGRLLKRYRQGEAGLPAHLEDYTFLAYGLVELYEATFDPKYLAAACELADTMIARFHDDGDGAFFHTADDGEQLLVRSKDVYDGAIPSGNSVAATVLAKLGRMTGRADYEKASAEVLEAFAGSYQRGASQFSQSMMALDFAIGPTREVVLAGDLADPELQAMRREIWRTFDPNLVVLHRPVAEDSPIIKLSEFLKHNGPIDGKPTAYVCQDFHCEAPVTTAAALRTSLKAK